MARILGLDIDSGAVRGALLKTALRKVEVLGYVEVPRSTATDPEGRAADLQEAIRTVAASFKPPADRVIALLPGTEASFRTVELPAGAAKRIAEVLPFELESTIPFDITESVIDHQIIEKTATEVRLMVVAAPKDRIATTLAELQDAGVSPRQLAAGALALDGLVPLVPVLQEPGPILVVRLGNEDTDLCMFRNGVAELARTLSTGVRAAEDGSLERAIKQTLTSYRARGKPAPSKVLLTGSSSDPTAVAWLADRLGLPVEPVTLPTAPGAEEPALTARFGRAAALAARPTIRERRIDLRKGEFAPKQGAGGILKQHAKLLAACAALVLFSFVFSAVARWLVLADEQEILMAELSRTTEEAFDEPAETAAAARRLLERGPRSADPLPRFDAYDALEAISANIPEEISHDTRRLHIELDDEGHSGRFELQGRVASVAERDQIAQQLEDHDCIRDIEKGPTRPGPGGEGLSYEIEAVLRCSDAPEPEDDRRSRRRER